MKFKTENGRLILAEMEKSSPGYQIPCWRSRLCGAWLRQINDVVVHSLEDVRRALSTLCARNEKSCTLVFSHPAIRHGLTDTGITQVNIDKLNPRLMFRYLNKEISPDHPTEDTTLHCNPVSLPHVSIGDSRNKIATVHCGEVWNFKSVAYRLTCGKLLKQPDWSEWRTSEWTQFDQYYDKGMFGKPVKVDSNKAVLLGLDVCH